MQPESRAKRGINKRTLLAAVLFLIVMPATLACGILFLKDKKYYIVCLLLIVYAMLPFFFLFENRRPQARELVVIAVLCAIGVAGRAAFFMVPQFKPVAAVVILAGVCFGAESGFLVGAMTAFVSNFFFGQGPWTPWQMFAFGLIGFLAGLLFKEGRLPRKRLPLCAFGAVAILVLYGGITNISSVLLFTAGPSWQTAAATYLAALPFDISHALSTVFFLFVLTNPMLEKLGRIRKKYGLLRG